MSVFGGELNAANYMKDMMAPAQRGVAGGALGQALSGAQRSTPADDLVAAIGNVNRCIERAVAAGWSVDVSAHNPNADDKLSVTPHRVVRAAITKDA